MAVITSTEETLLPSLNGGRVTPVSRSGVQIGGSGFGSVPAEATEALSDLPIGWRHLPQSDPGDGSPWIEWRDGKWVYHPRSDGSNQGDLGDGTLNTDSIHEGDSEYNDSNQKIDDYNNRGSEFYMWNPDPDASPEENLKSLENFLTVLFNSTSYPDSGFVGGSFFSKILQSAWYACSRVSSWGDLDAEGHLALAEKIADLSWNYISMQYEQALSYQSWYLQQEYNSPINQINRLAQAGLSSCFALGSYSSGNAQSPAGVASAQPAQPSGAAEIARQGNSDELGFVQGLISTAGSLIPGIGGAVSQLINAYCAKKLTPKQMQKLDDDHNLSAVQEDVLRQSLEESKQNCFVNLFDSIVKGSNELVNEAGRKVDVARERHQLNLEHYTKEIETQGIRTKVITKGGQSEWRTISNQEFKQGIENGWKLEDGSTIGHDSSIEGSMELSQSLGIPGIGEAKVSGKFGASKSKHDSNSHVEGSSGSSNSSVSHSSQGYDSKGTSFTIGNTTYECVTLRKRVPLEGMEQYIKRSEQDLQNALDEFDTLQAGEKRRLFDLLDKHQRNLKNFSAACTHRLFMKRINELGNDSILSGD